MNPEEILDRTDACKTLKVSRQTLWSWIRKGKLKVWKRVGHGSNAALLFNRADVEALKPQIKPNLDRSTQPPAAPEPTLIGSSTGKPANGNAESS